MSVVGNQIQSLLSRLQTAFNGVQTNHRILEDAFSPGVSQLTLTPRTRRAFEKVVKLMDEVCKACQNSRLNLKNSPPFILDILPETYQLLVQIFKLDPDVLRENYYLRVFFDNVHRKCKGVLKLFRTNVIFDELSQERRSLTKYSLIFSHMLSELKSEFPNGIFVGGKFRITKKEAAEFWENSFKSATLVQWTEFVNELVKVHPMTDLEQLALKETMDLTGNDHVSNFEFDVFTRLFYPWKSLLQNWQLLTTAHPGYVAFLTYDEVKKVLEKLTERPGSYVFRLSCTRLGQWAIGYVAPDGKIYQTIPQNKSLIQALIEGSKEGFYLFPNGQTKDIDLTASLEAMPADRIRVTSDQYEIYCEMGTTFELCKICDDNEKNIKIEPCGHLLCQQCLTTWQDSSEGGNTCPFCRYEIKGTSKVVIESFAPILGRKSSSAKRGSVQVSARKPAPAPESCRKIPEVKLRSASDSAANEPCISVEQNPPTRSYQDVSSTTCELTASLITFDDGPSNSQRSSRLRPSMGIKERMRRLSKSNEQLEETTLCSLNDLNFDSPERKDSGSSSAPTLAAAPPLHPRKSSPTLDITDLPVAPPPPRPPKTPKTEPNSQMYMNVSEADKEKGYVNASSFPQNQ